MEDERKEVQGRERRSPHFFLSLHCFLSFSLPSLSFFLFFESDYSKHDLEQTASAVAWCLVLCSTKKERELWKMRGGMY
jgi:hypothetical protein